MIRPGLSVRTDAISAEIRVRFRGQGRSPGAGQEAGEGEGAQGAQEEAGERWAPYVVGDLLAIGKLHAFDELHIAHDGYSL